MSKRLVGIITIVLLSLSSLLILWEEATKMQPHSERYASGVWLNAASEVAQAQNKFETGFDLVKHRNDPMIFATSPSSLHRNARYDTDEPRTRTVRGKDGGALFTTVKGSHGDYLTTTDKCEDCHTLRRVSIAYPPLRADVGAYTSIQSGTSDDTLADTFTQTDTDYEPCDFCHGSGAASGLSIQTDNDSLSAAEFNVGHSMGFGLASGKWKAPDDTYPAFTPKYSKGGFTCTDCHSAHGTPEQLLGFSSDGTREYPIYNPGYPGTTTSTPDLQARYPAGSWLLLKNPDREIDPVSGVEIADTDVESGPSILWNGVYRELPVNKQAISWEEPVSLSEGSGGPMDDGFKLSEFCVDCHDGNAGLSTQQAAVFSEDRALRAQSEIDSYEISSSHDSNQRHGGTHILFNPEDGKNSGPSCRSCHRGSSDCSMCHPTSIPSSTTGDTSIATACRNYGFSWPHKTLAWKMLKDDLFGIDFDGQTLVDPGESRTLPSGENISQEDIEIIEASGFLNPAHDLDSACLDCHNPTIWNATSTGRTDDPALASDDFNDELIMRGLP